MLNSKNKSYFTILSIFIFVFLVTHVDASFKYTLLKNKPEKLVKASETLTFSSNIEKQSPTYSIFLPNIDVPIFHYLPIVSNNSINLNYQAWEAWKELGPNSASNGGITNFKTGAGIYGTPSMAVTDDGIVYVAYSAYSDISNNRNIYVKRWTGTQWEQLGESLVSDPAFSSFQPSLAISPSGQPYVAYVSYDDLYWSSDRCPPVQIFIRRWNGNNWEAFDSSEPVCGSGISGYFYSSYPRIVFSPNGVLYVTFLGRYYDTSNEVLARQWNGQGWIKMRIGGLDNWGKFPDIAISIDETAYVVWLGHADIQSVQWQDGQHSSMHNGLPEISNYSMVPITISNNGTPFIAWAGEFSSVSQIYVKKWHESSWSSWIGVGDSASDGGISNTRENSFTPSIANSNSGKIYVAWLELNDIFVRRWNGEIWEEVGFGSALADGISITNKASAPIIAVDSDERIYVAWLNKDENGISQIYIRYANE